MASKMVKGSSLMMKSIRVAASRAYASIAVGSDVVSAAPNVSLQKARSWDEGVSSKFSTTPLSELFKGKKVVIFGLPGAYTGVCSAQHVPSYKNNIDKFKAKGIDSVVCVAVNDPYVMNGWAEKLEAKDAIEFYGDFDGSFHKSLDLTIDLSSALLGTRSHRWSAYVDDGKVKVLNVETAPSEFKAMASEEDQKFPPQHQDTQPGKQYLMHPLPISVNPKYKPSNKLHGKVALVTGGDSGIGRAVCYYFALEGATVAFTYVKGQEDKDAHEALALIREAKASDAEEPIAIPADLRTENNCKKVVDEVVSRFGRIDVLVNNAAVQYYAESIEEITEERLRNTFELNIFAYFFLARYSLKHMKEGSSIINTASSLAYQGEPTLLEYSSTKGAIVSFTRSLSLQLAKRGIRVNGVAPGPVWTPLQVASLPDERITIFGSETPMDRAAQPYEIAPSYVFLASNECSSFMSGQFLHPNGGMIVNA